MENKSGGAKARGSKFVVRGILPWFVGVGMLLVYSLTLNRWVSPDSLFHISNLGGTLWQPELSQPVLFLVTFPLRWLPATLIPPAANFFSAVCAAISLGWLARAVLLLPHDRTKEERQRNANAAGYLVIPGAWLPPILAALACGLQLTFWDHAVAATGEMFDLLLFAYLVRCLLEFRASGKKSWLLRFALVNGLAVANNWAMAAFLPAFLLALFWLQGFFRFFKPSYFAQFLKSNERLNWRLPLEMFVCWLAGASLFLFLPLLASRSRISHVDFWPALQFSIRVYEILLSSSTLTVISGLALMALLPVVFLGIRWGRLLSEVNPFAVWFTTVMFHVVHAFFLFGTLWMLLDSPFSPRTIQPYFPCLPLYYLMGLSVGYYSGYFLLVFRPLAEKARRYWRHPVLPFLNFLSVAGLGALLLLTPSVLVYKNLPLLRREKSGALAGYLDALQNALPPAGAVILSEDPVRLQYLQAALARRGKTADYLPVDTGLLTRQPTYFEFLERQHPAFKLSTLVARPNSLTNTADLVLFLNSLSRAHDLYFMHPFAGYLGELFYQQPRKLLYQLKPYSANSYFAPPPGRELSAENEAFWQGLTNRQFPELLRRLQPVKAPVRRNLFEWILRSCHIAPTLDANAMLAGGYYALMLDGWGVELQRMGRLPEAGRWFQEAGRLNPENNAAQINRDCNRDLQNHRPLVLDPALGLEEKFNQRRDWDQSLRQDGPADEPNVCYRFGVLFSNIHMYRQSLQQFARAQQLAPGDLNIALRLTECYLNLNDRTNALAEAEFASRVDPQNSRALFLKGFALVRNEKFTRAISVFNELLRMETNNTDALLLRGFAWFKTGAPANARRDYDLAAKTALYPYGAYYALAELGYYTRDPALALTNCELYLSHAPAGAPEAIQINAWLAELKARKTKPAAEPPRSAPSK